ncbi:putative integral membrane protein [Actinokineospora spheciospongiae]|uniref:Putative integral membrane protein n=1 Tax=Actinokineospora spheciospongiae TaxID=909613 RepID=W7J3I6_9PSEU|nr:MULTISPECIES: hypothetical protein [Actinokineospora]EWC60689.1 putative integral membrane protein [Actinokineospora spheciospongiae]MCG8918955.1 hypothetical protein [Actinokineospora sp. PR83]
MTMSRRVSLFLLAFGVWSWIIWPTFLGNIWADERSFDPSGAPTGFLVVHVVLTAASLLFGTTIGVLGWRGFAATRRKAA